MISLHARSKSRSWLLLAKVYLNHKTKIEEQKENAGAEKVKRGSPTLCGESGSVNFVMLHAWGTGLAVKGAEGFVDIVRHSRMVDSRAAATCLRVLEVN
jgi:hypothetical protein